jgi:hypothetical protein
MRSVHTVIMLFVAIISYLTGVIKVIHIVKQYTDFENIDATSWDQYTG